MTSTHLYGTASEPPMTGRPPRCPLNVDAIAARADAAPGGCWEAFTDTLWIPWSASTDDDTGDQFCSGRWLAVREGHWHTGSQDPPPELWTFLAAARDDVLNLAAEVRRLRAALASHAAADGPDTPRDWQQPAA